jgi:hypothetical protein
MYFETASARDQFTHHDFNFIVDTLSQSEAEADALYQLLVDQAESNQVFDDPALAQRLETGENLSLVSARFFLYIMMRKTLRQSGIENRDVADYLANMLARFMEHDRLRCAPNTSIMEIIDYEHDLLVALQAASHYRRYEIHAYGGDRNLFMTGLHSRFLRHRANRTGAPGLSYYEQAGRSHYLRARDHPVCREFDLRDTFDALAQQFGSIRHRLNYLAEEHFN